MAVNLPSGAASSQLDLDEGATPVPGKQRALRPAMDLAVASSEAIEPTGASTLR
jgi:hypothetical protein